MTLCNKCTIIEAIIKDQGVYYCMSCWHKHGGLSETWKFIDEEIE